jgi:hypothetical protein
MTDEPPLNRPEADAPDGPPTAQPKPGSARSDHGGKEADPRTDLPAAGPHAEPGLVDEEKTPGSGAMPDIGDGGDTPVQPGSG